MKLLEIIAGIIAGAGALVLIGWFAVRGLQAGRAAAEENKRIYEDYERHISKKP